MEAINFPVVSVYMMLFRREEAGFKGFGLSTVFLQELARKMRKEKTQSVAFFISYFLGSSGFMNNI